MAKQVLRYLKGTHSRCLKFVKGTLKLVGYSDLDWAMSDDRCSISGYAFKLCDERSLIPWKSKKQSIVALSSCEAEYVALADLMCHPCTRKFVCMYVDNQGAIA